MNGYGMFLSLFTYLLIEGEVLTKWRYINIFSLPLPFYIKTAEQLTDHYTAIYGDWYTGR